MFFCWNHVFFKFEVSVISSDHAFAQIVPLLAAFTVAASEFGSQTFNKHFSPTTPWVFPWLSCSFIFNLQEFWNGFKKRFHISECICFLFVRICTLSLYLLSMFQLRSYKIIDFIGCKCPRCNGPERLRLNQVENSNLGGAGAVHFLSPDLPPSPWCFAPGPDLGDAKSLVFDEAVSHATFQVRPIFQRITLSHVILPMRVHP